MDEITLLREQAKALRLLARSLEPLSMRTGVIDIANWCEAIADEWDRERQALPLGALGRLVLAIFQMPLSLEAADILF
jgi:hypothetical protein